MMNVDHVAKFMIPSQPLTLYPLGGTPHLTLATPDVRGFWTCCTPL